MSPHGTHFTAESTEAMRIKCLAQGNNILLPGFEPSTSVSKTDILANRPIFSRLCMNFCSQMSLSVVVVVVVELPQAPEDDPQKR